MYNAIFTNWTEFITKFWRNLTTNNYNPINCYLNSNDLVTSRSKETSRKYASLNVMFPLWSLFIFSLDTVAAISEKQKMLQKQRKEIEEIERNSDREVRFGKKRCASFLCRWCYQRHDLLELGYVNSFRPLYIENNIILLRWCGSLRVWFTFRLPERSKPRELR